MALHLTLPIVVRAAGPALFVLLGLALALRSRGRRERVALGIFLSAQGAAIVASNLGIAGGGVPAFLAGAALAVVATLAAIVVIVEASRAQGGGGMRGLDIAGVLALGLVVAAIGAWEFLPISRLGLATFVPADAIDAFQIFGLALAGVESAILVLPLAWALAAFRTRGAPDERALFDLSLGLLLVAGFTAGTDALSGGNILYFAPGPTALVLVLLGASAWLAVAISRQDVNARNVALVALASLLAGMLRHAISGGVDTVFDPYATVGLARLVAWAIIALTIVHAGWLDLHFLPRHRAGLAAAALAALFIVAQIAQNFLAAEYGLLMGGIVAGAFLFAATPLQRAVESIRERRVEVAPRTGAPTADAAAEDVYRAALRIALQDRRVTADEELHLAELGERLGLPARRALQLRHEIEKEARK